jgi:3-oxoadipate enol-lactonase
MSALHLNRTEGSGRPLVLLHGVYLDHRLWDEVRAAFPSRATLAVDLPGHGRSRPLGSHESIDEVAGSVADAVRSAGIRDAIWVGHSWGGWVLARVAATDPDLVGGAVYSNTPARKASGKRRTGFLAQRWLLRFGFPLATYGRLAAKSLYDPATLSARPALADELAARVKSMGRTQVIRTVSNVVLGTPDSIELIAATAVPYRVVAGEQDYVLDDEVVTRFGPVLGRAAGGHITPQADPGAIVRAVEVLDGSLSRSSSS